MNSSTIAVWIIIKDWSWIYLSTDMFQNNYKLLFFLLNFVNIQENTDEGSTVYATHHFCRHVYSLICTGNCRLCPSADIIVPNVTQQLVETMNTHVHCQIDPEYNGLFITLFNDMCAEIHIHRNSRTLINVRLLLKYHVHRGIKTQISLTSNRWPGGKSTLSTGDVSSLPMLFHQLQQVLRCYLFPTWF